MSENAESSGTAGVGAPVEANSNKTEKRDKLPYEPPEVIDHGGVGNVTHGFPGGTTELWSKHDKIVAAD